MPVRVGVVGEGDAVLVLEADQPRHGIGTGGVHTDLSVVIYCHEGEPGVVVGFTTTMSSP